MTGKGLIIELTGIKPIEGADNIQQASIAGEIVIISKDLVEGSLGILFDMETQLSHDFVHNNNMYAIPDNNLDTTKKGYISDTRRIRPVKLRGVKCTALFMPLESLSFTGSDVSVLKPNSYLSSLNNIEICKRYVSTKQKAHVAGQGAPKKSKKKKVKSPFFKEHIETSKIWHGLTQVPLNKELVITTKLHGTSCRVGLLPTTSKGLLNKAFRWVEEKFNVSITQYLPVVGSRRQIVMVGDKESIGGYYTDNIYIRSFKHKLDLLNKGETLYFEIVGYTHGSKIMPDNNLAKIKHMFSKSEYNALIKKYGETQTYSYNCDEGHHDIYVYRITNTNIDGEIVELSWDQVKVRCERLGIKHVPEVARLMPTSHDELEEQLKHYSNIECDVFKDHIKEGICIRWDNGGDAKIMKSHSDLFKLCKFDNVEIDREEVN